MIYYDRSISGQIKPKNVLERLWINSIGDSDDECWICVHKGSKAGYVRIRLDDESRMMVHRLAYEAYYAEPIPNGYQINHHCDNPKCFNPNHLYLGTQKENMQDRSKRNRHNCFKKLTIADVEYIKNSSKTLEELSIEFSVTIQAIKYHRKRGF